MIILTSIYWWFDTLKKLPYVWDKKFICVTDWDVQVEEWAEWEIIVNNDLKHLHPRIQAKYVRTHPFLFWDDVMWIDACARLKDENSLDYFINQKQWDITTFKHSTRDCISQEAQFCIDNDLPKSKWQPLMEQAEFYFRQWFPRNYWLSCTSILLYNKSTRLENFLEDWRHQNLMWSYQDQMSFEYCIWKHKIDRHWFDKIQIEQDEANFYGWHLKQG